MAELKCLTCIHGELCLYQQGGVNLSIISEDCEHYKPTADVVEMRHGEWIYKHRHRGGFDKMTTYDDFGNPHIVTIDNRYECEEPYCSVCGKLGGDFLNYCGNCGAKMDGGKNGTLY